MKSENPLRRAPLSDRQLEALFDAARPGPRIVAAAPGLWGKTIATDLVAVARAWSTDETRYRDDGDKDFGIGFYKNVLRSYG